MKIIHTSSTLPFLPKVLRYATAYAVFCSSLDFKWYLNSAFSDLLLVELGRQEGVCIYE